jgi:DNA helicase II / ATP-dependent DNA helicase PcrA
VARREKFVADLHVHSYLARACSPLLRPEPLHRWAQLKGIRVLSTGDFTHPRWRAELKAKLVEAEQPGLFQLRPSLARLADKEVPAACRAPVRFMLGVEVACIYKKDGKLRRLHHLVYAPGWSEADRFVASLMKEGCNLSSDGRPITGLDSRRLLELCLAAGPDVHLVPAHAWTPHFAVFGSESGFDSMTQCFEDLTPHVFALETGLSSDPAMNRRVSALDGLSLLSNSDAHSLETLGREANVFDAKLSYKGLFDAVRGRDASRFTGTIEFHPAHGKYHVDGHRDCGQRLHPADTIRRSGACPECGRPVTVGVAHRVEKLADRAEGPAERCEYLVPLRELLGELLGVGAKSMKVARAYKELTARFGPELFILRELDPRAAAESGNRLLALALTRMRAGLASIEPGYDGVYGKVTLLRPEDRAGKGQLALV